MPYHPEHLAPLAPEGAFVVQFRTDLTVAVAPLAGRVEHIVSGQARRFASGAELLAFMEEVLRCQGADPHRKPTHKTDEGVAR